MGKRKGRVIIPDNASVTFLNHAHDTRPRCRDLLVVYNPPIGHPATYCAAPYERRTRVRRTTKSKHTHPAMDRGPAI
jgi:hypothetical protein